VLVNAKALCQALRTVIEGQNPLDTTKYCADSLLALARCFDEARATFLDLAKTVHHKCSQLLQAESLGGRMEEFRPLVRRFMMLSNRGIDMSFGSMPMLDRMIELLGGRADWLRQKKVDEAAVDEAAAAAENPAGAEEGGSSSSTKRKRLEEDGPADVLDARLALQLLEAASTSVMWHVRMSFWVENQGAVSEEGRSAAEKQVSEMLQGFGELPALRVELPRTVSRLRDVCCRLIESDQSAHVKYHAYCAYMALVQLAVGVSDKLCLEVSEDGGATVGPTGWGATFEVHVSKRHMQADL
ncbi:unnamed protein product, partial [Polarella glacialis]